MKYSVITSSYNQLEQLKRLREALDGQTFSDFEWIVADDGSSDGTAEWAKKNADKFVTQENKGYRLTRILNKAADVAEGEYLVWIMGDSYPYKNFLETIGKYTHPEKILNGLRMNIDRNGKIVERDWRIRGLKMGNEKYLKITSEKPWGYMTLNSMVMPRAKYEEMGGIFAGYDKGYGRMDWDMVAWGDSRGMELGWVTNAFIFHRTHKKKDDTENNIKLFELRVKEMYASRT